MLGFEPRPVVLRLTTRLSMRSPAMKRRTSSNLSSKSCLQQLSRVYRIVQTGLGDTS